MRRPSRTTANTCLPDTMNPQRARIVPWSFPGDSTPRRESGLRTLRFHSGGTYLICFIENPMQFYRYFVNGRTAICGDPATCPFRAKDNVEPTIWYAANIFDRGEASPRLRLKIIQFSTQLFREVSTWATMNKADPSGINGCDFRVQLSLDKPVRYAVTPGAVMPFTAEETEIIHAGSYDLGRLFVPTPPDRIEEQLFVPRTGAG